jgi:hypothetical protein
VAVRRRPKSASAGCAHSAQYRRAVRVDVEHGQIGSISLRKLGTCRNTKVVATWCERCGAVEVSGSWRHPMARVQEDDDPDLR